MSVIDDVHKLLTEAHNEVVKLEGVAKDQALKIEHAVLAAVSAVEQVLENVVTPTPEPEPTPEPDPTPAPPAIEYHDRPTGSVSASSN